MNLKKLWLKSIIIFSCILYFSGVKVCCEEVKDLRTMFQNNEAVIYAINMRTFNAADYDGDGIIDFLKGEHSGSFINAIERLDELKDIGVNAIHLLPVTPAGKIKALGTAGSLYAISDFTSLNLQLFDEKSDLSLKEQAKKFTDECHKRNIKVIVDLPSCGSYDLFINRPDLFITDKDGSAYVPADWLDVRVFDVSDNRETLLKSDIFIMHKAFVNYMLALGVDGIRADVATIKPYIFWKELISYTRSRKPDFMFLAEASEAWTQPACDKSYFTDYKKLLEAGFDGWYGDFFNLKDIKNFEDFANGIKHKQSVISKYSDKKAVIGSFATHDVVSPLITGGENFAKIIIWLNATLPLNPYYIDGFLQADDYVYDYSNKKAKESYTDDDYYYVHQGQIDIFNFSRKPGGDTDELLKEHQIAMKLRNECLPQITQGAFEPLKSSNNNVFAYKRTYGKKSVYVIINRNTAGYEDVKLKISYNKKSKVTYIRNNPDFIINQSSVDLRLKPAEIIVFTVEN